MNKQKGFTLIELLVVIAIIALLMSIIMPALRKAKTAAQMAICASNQRQCITGVLTYAVDNNGSFPPDISNVTRGMSNIPNSWANCLNYHPGNPVSDNSGAMFTYLGSYLPNVHVFMCPVSPGSNHTKYMQDLYENPLQVGDGTTLVSYNMYWGGYTIPEGIEGLSRKFVGPKGTGSKADAGLMLCDVMTFWGRDDLWWMSHRPNRGNIIKLEVDPLTGTTNVEMLWTVLGTISDVPNKVQMNAGYVDGHVERYDSVREAIYYEQLMHRFYMPQKWR